MLQVIKHIIGNRGVQHDLRQRLSDIQISQTELPRQSALPLMGFIVDEVRLTYTVSSGEGTKARELIISNHEAPAGLL